MPRPFPPVPVHYVSNVLVEEFDDEKQQFRVSSALQVAEYRQDKQMFYSASCEHVLRVHNNGLKIAAKRVDLINSQAVLNSISVPTITIISDIHATQTSP